MPTRLDEASQVTSNALAARVIGALLACSLTPAWASAPMATFQAPGFQRMMLGDFEVTALNDGVIDYDTAKVLPTATPRQIKEEIGRAHV